MGLLSDDLAEDDFSGRAGLDGVAYGVYADVDDAAHSRGRFDVRVLVEDEENVLEIDGGAELV